jgi:hypothetical protein
VNLKAVFVRHSGEAVMTPWQRTQLALLEAMACTGEMASAALGEAGGVDRYKPTLRSARARHGSA